MTTLTVDQALENIYASLENNNHDIDTHIDALKAALVPTGSKSVTANPERLVQNNRQGRKLMQSYFKKRGVLVEFAA